MNLESFLRGDRNAWFLNEERSGGIVLDAMIHDLNLMTATYGRPTAVEEITGTHRVFPLEDTVQVALRYPGFTAQLLTSWTRSQDRPIQTRVAWALADGTGGQIRCDDYITPTPGGDSPYVRQMRAFLELVTTGKMSHPLAGYLDATALALDIQAHLHAQRHGPSL